VIIRDQDIDHDQSSFSLVYTEYFSWLLFAGPMEESNTSGRAGGMKNREPLKAD
jgi:hypothetical protein